MRRSCEPCRRIHSSCVMASPSATTCIRCDEHNSKVLMKGRGKPRQCVFLQSDQGKRNDLICNEDRTSATSPGAPSDDTSLRVTAVSGPEQMPDEGTCRKIEKSLLTAMAASTGTISDVSGGTDGKSAPEQMPGEGTCRKIEKSLLTAMAASISDGGGGDYCTYDGSSAFEGEEYSSDVDAPDSHEYDSDYSEEGSIPSHHHGMALQDFTINVGSEGNASSSYVATPVSTSCTGRRKAFTVMIMSKAIYDDDIASRIRPTTSPENADAVVFLECPQLTNKMLKRQCTGKIIAFTPPGDTNWYLGIISSISVRNSTDLSEDGPGGVMSLYEWKGHTSIIEGCCVPTFYLLEDRNNYHQFFDLRHISFSGRKSMLFGRQGSSNGFCFCFVNQILGRTPKGVQLAHGIVNATDGAFQASFDGGDHTHLPIRPTKSKDRDRYLNGNKEKTEYVAPSLPANLHRSFLVDNPQLSKSVPTNDKKKKKEIRKKKRKERSKVSKIMTQVASDEDSRRHISHYLKPPKKCLSGNTPITAAVVTKLDGTPLDREAAIKLPEGCEDKEFFISPADFMNKSQTMRVYAATRAQYKEVLKKSKEEFVTVESADEFLLKNTSFVTETVCINDSGSDKHHLSKVFAGSSTPTTEGWERKDLPGIGVRVYHTLSEAETFDQYVSLSTSFVDICTHPLQLNFSHHEVVQAAFSNKGTQPSRSSTGHCHGSCTFLGYKTNTSQCVPTPTEGPGDRAEYLRYRQFINTCYAVTAIHLLNQLAFHTYWTASLFFREIHLWEFDPDSSLGNSRLIIWTTDFSNCLHIDKNDIATESDSKDFKEKCSNVLSCSLTTPQDKMRIQNYTLFLDRFLLVMYTTCCYQFFRTRLGMKHLEVDVQVLQAFLNFGLGMTCRVHNYWTHCMSAANFLHSTCVPTFVSNNRVYFGSHPYVTVAAWGTGSSSDAEKERRARDRERERERRAAEKEREKKRKEADRARARRIIERDRNRAADPRLDRNRAADPRLVARHRARGRVEAVIPGHFTVAALMNRGISRYHAERAVQRRAAVTNGQRAGLVHALNTGRQELDATSDPTERRERQTQLNIVIANARNFVSREGGNAELDSLLQLYNNNA